MTEDIDPRLYFKSCGADPGNNPDLDMRDPGSPTVAPADGIQQQVATSLSIGSIAFIELLLQCVAIRIIFA